MKKLLLLVILIGMTAFHAQGKIREKRSIVRLETTMGNIRIALNDETPVHRDNFLKLVSEGFYDGTLFHRVVKDFVIQAGDPDSKQAPGGKILGEGGPGYMLAPEIDLPFQYHKRGAVAMAREDDANNPDRLSNGSQFYIVWGKKYRPRELAFAWAGLRGGLYGDFETNREMEQEYLRGHTRVRRRIHRIRRGHRRAQCGGKHPIHRNRFPRPTANRHRNPACRGRTKIEEGRSNGQKAVFGRIILKTSDFIGVFFSLRPPAHDGK